MLDKVIEAKSKAVLQSSTSIREMDAHCWKGQKPDKKEKTSKTPKKKNKAKPAYNQPIPLLSTQALGKNSCRTWGNRCNWQPSHAAAGIPATDVNLVNTTLNNNSDGEQNRSKKDPSQIIHWNYDQKSHYSSKCSQLLKPKN